MQAKDEAIKPAQTGAITDEQATNDERSAIKVSAKAQPEQADINDVYARVAAALEELFAHLECPVKVYEAFCAAQTEIINQTGVLTEESHARFFLTAAMAEIGKREADSVD